MDAARAAMWPRAGAVAVKDDTFTSAISHATRAHATGGLGRIARARPDSLGRSDSQVAVPSSTLSSSAAIFDVMHSARTPWNLITLQVLRN